MPTFWALSSVAVWLFVTKWHLSSLACSFLLVLFSSWLSRLLPHCRPPSPASLLSTGCEFALFPVTGFPFPFFCVSPGNVLLEATVSIICESLLHPVSTHNFQWSSPWSECTLQSAFCLKGGSGERCCGRASFHTLHFVGELHMTQSPPLEGKHILFPLMSSYWKCL